MSKPPPQNSAAPPPVPVSRIAVALALSLGGFLLALPLWPALHGWFADLLLSLMQSLLSLRGSGMTIETPIAAAAQGFLVNSATDAVLLSADRQSALSVESFANLYVPCVAWLCLALATPRSLQRRLILAAAGLLPVIAFCWLRLECLAAHQRFAAPSAEAPRAAALFAWLAQAFVNPPAMQFAPALLVWLLLGFRTADWRDPRRIG